MTSTLSNLSPKDTRRSVRRLNVLVLSWQLPKSERDFLGIFVHDAITSLSSVCDMHVLLSDAIGERAFQVDTVNGVKYYRTSFAPAWFPQRLKRGLYLPLFWHVRSLAKHLKHIDIIHAHGSVLAGVPACLLARRLKVPVVLTVHSEPSRELAKPIAGRLGKWAHRSVDLLLPVSEYLKRELQTSNIGDVRIEVGYNPVDTEFFRPPHCTTRPKNILFVGRLVPFKGAHRAVKAFNKIANEFPDWTMTIVGDGPERQTIAEYIRKQPALQDKVALVGSGSRSEVAAHMKRAAFLVHPSEHETFGIVLAEANSAGLPVIAPNTTAPIEFIDASSGLLVPPRDIQAISEAMRYMITHIHKYDANQMRHNVVDRFSFPSYRRRISHFYRELVQD